MKKSDLKNGRVVEVRNGDLYLVVGDFITREFDYEQLSKYDDDLLHDINSDYDIVRVYEHKNDLYDNNSATIKMLFNREYLTLLCERGKHNLTEREVEVLKALQTLGHEWLARDDDGELFAFGDEPEKSNSAWIGRFNKSAPIDEDLFAFIKWEDKEPVSIKELLK